MDYFTLKALHIIGFTCWFAGLFYVVRLFVYHAEAAAQPPHARDVLWPQLELMQARLWNIITVPAMWVTLGAGLSMLWLKGSLEPWLHVKLGLLALLVITTCTADNPAPTARPSSRWTPRGLRMFNEGATCCWSPSSFSRSRRTPSAWSAIWTARPRRRADDWNPHRRLRGDLVHDAPQATATAHSPLLTESLTDRGATASMDSLVEPVREDGQTTQALAGRG